MGMKWERADRAVIDDKARYLVVTNGAEWHDNDVELMYGLMVMAKLKPTYVRGRPEWVCQIRLPVKTTSR